VALPRRGLRDRRDMVRDDAGVFDARVVVGQLIVTRPQQVAQIAQANEQEAIGRCALAPPLLFVTPVNLGMRVLLGAGLVPVPRITMKVDAQRRARHHRPAFLEGFRS
jgi:hypothetical protein